MQKTKFPSWPNYDACSLDKSVIAEFSTEFIKKKIVRPYSQIFSNTGWYNAFYLYKGLLGTSFFSLSFVSSLTQYIRIL